MKAVKKGKINLAYFVMIVIIKIITEIKLFPIISGRKKNGQEILVQLVTDELTKEIVTFFPLNVQNLKDGEFRIVPNEGEDYEDDKSNNTNDESNNASDKSNNATKTKIYDIFQLIFDSKK